MKWEAFGADLSPEAVVGISALQSFSLHTLPFTRAKPSPRVHAISVSAALSGMVLSFPVHSCQQW